MRCRSLVLVIALTVPLLCMGTFVLGYFYGHLRMASVNRDVFTLAEQLGYTPDVLVTHRTYDRDYSLFFPWGGVCDTKLYFTSRLDRTGLAQKLSQTMPQKNDTVRKDYSASLYREIGLAVSDSDAKKVQDDFWQKYIVSYYWPLTVGAPDSVILYDTANMSVGVEYKGRRIQDNIVQIYKSGGRFPIWMDCPTKTVERMPLPSK